MARELIRRIGEAIRRSAALPNTSMSRRTMLFKTLSVVARRRVGKEIGMLGLRTGFGMRTVRRVRPCYNRPLRCFASDLQRRLFASRGARNKVEQECDGEASVAKQQRG